MFRRRADTADWQDASAALIETVADLLTRMSNESHDMQASIGSAVEEEADAVAALMKLQKLDFHTQKQADLASILRVLATGIRQGDLDVDLLKDAAVLQETRDTISRQQARTTQRRVSLGSLDWFE